MRTSRYPNRIDEESSPNETWTNKQIPTGAGSSSYHFVFLIACRWRYDTFNLEGKAKKRNGPCSSENDY